MDNFSHLKGIVQIQSRLDANETHHALQDLLSVEAKLYERKYPDLKSDTLIPVDTSDPVGNDNVAFDLIDQIGQARVTHDKAKDIPNVDVISSRTTKPVVPIRAKWEWTTNDLENWSASGKNFAPMKMAKVRDACERKRDSVAALGDSDVGIEGFTNYTGVGSSAAPNGTWSSATTVADMLEDVNFILTEHINALKDVTELTPNTLVLPINDYMLFSTNPNAQTDRSALSIFMGNQAFVTRVVPWRHLTDKAILYRNDPEVLVQKVPKPFTMGPAVQQNSFCFEQAGEIHTAGPCIRFLPGVRYLTGL